MNDLVVCFDGTRNKEKTGTNVYRLYKFLRKDEGQEVLYVPGVGTKTGEWARGLLFGWGLSRQIKSAYGWLAERWREGDRIWVFGFSRGAYAARSLAGMIGMRGIPAGADAGKEYDGYRRGERTGSAEVWFTGVFDTVGKLGIPDTRKWLNWLDRPGKYRFHDTRPGAHLRHARHAVAMDETRVLFMPTLWTGADGLPLERAEGEGRTLKQVWFRGVHSDIGGHMETGTNDVALGWMMDEAAALGLRFEPGAREAVRGDPFAKLGKEEGWMWERAPRAVPEIQAGNGNLHPSVLARRKKLKDPWTPHQETSGWVETAEGRRSVCTGMWLEAEKEARIWGEYGKTKMWGFVANGGDPSPDGTWGGHQAVPLDGSPVTVKRGGYLHVASNRHAAKGVCRGGRRIPAGRVCVQADD